MGDGGLELEWCEAVGLVGPDLMRGWVTKGRLGIVGIVSDDNQPCLPVMNMWSEIRLWPVTQRKAGPLPSGNKDVRVLGGVFRPRPAHYGHQKSICSLESVVQRRHARVMIGGARRGARSP